MRRRIALSVMAMALSLPVAAVAQAPVDSVLARYINAIRAIDDHAHPMRPIAPGAPADSEYDALPLDGIPPFDVPNRLKPDDPIWRAAQQALYKIRPDLAGAAYHTELKSSVEKNRATLGASATRLSNRFDAIPWPCAQARYSHGY